MTGAKKNYSEAAYTFRVEAHECKNGKFDPVIVIFTHENGGMKHVGWWPKDSTGEFNTKQEALEWLRGCFENHDIILRAIDKGLSDLGKNDSQNGTEEEK